MNLFKGNKLGTRFLLLVLFLATVVIIESGVIITDSMGISAQSTQLAENKIPILNKAHELKLSVVQVQQWLTDISATRGRDGLNDGFDEAESSAKQFRRLIDKLMSLDHEHVGRYETMLPTFNAYYGAGKQMAQAYIDEGPTGGNQMMAQFDKAAAKIAEEVDGFLISVKEEAAATLSTQQALAASTERSAIIGALIVLLGIGFVYFIMSQALAYLPKIVAELQRVAEGDLTAAIDVTRQDEIGDLMLGLESMRKRLLSMISQISSTTAQLSSAAAEMTLVSQQSSSNIQQQQSETSQVATAMNEMTATVHEVAKSIASTANAANEANHETSSGSEVVDRSIKAARQLVHQIETASNVVQQLEQNSDSITTVLDVIQSIAEQTNLLALNAAIEAARAGEQGRGFAVVADEVRTLASRTQEATKEINQMIDKLQTGSQQAVKVMDQSQKQAASVVEQAIEAGASLATIATTVGKINDMSAQIASAAEEQSLVAEEINRNVVQINDLSNKNADSAEQSTISNKNLACVADELQKMVAQFQV
ncbi:MAG: methyl-accepting chemotaxis protein [Candidatus Polarisedimenticolaceae bacterium]|nr:methyl-accepting chemotaxis protein [Candidatus Polarisedimenticolaceae bacterium]